MPEARINCQMSSDLATFKVPGARTKHGGSNITSMPPKTETKCEKIIYLGIFMLPDGEPSSEDLV